MSQEQDKRSADPHAGMTMLPQVLRAELGNAMSGDLAAAERWLDTPQVELSGQTPEQAWAAGHTQAVIDLIRGSSGTRRRG